MIGVAFALQNTFGTSHGIEDAAFASVVHEFARLRNLHLKATGTEGTAISRSTQISTMTDLFEAFSTALSPYLLDAAEGMQLDAMFRMEAARLVADRFVPFDDVAPTLRQLESLNVPCVGLSGGRPSIDLWKARAVGFASPIIFAEDVGIRVSAPAAFARVAETVRLPAGNVWFVGTDVFAEILPAIAAGMHAVWINRDDEAFPYKRTPPDATIATFADLLDVLGEPYTRGLLALRHILCATLDSRPGRFVAGDTDLALEDEEHNKDAP